jgi:hypothetical protein
LNADQKNLHAVVELRMRRRRGAKDEARVLRRRGMDERAYDGVGGEREGRG